MLAKTEPSLPSRFVKLVCEFIVCRDLAEEIEARHKDELAPVIRDRETIRGLLLEMLEASGVKSARTDFGTVSIRTDSAASCSDPDMFMNFVKETGSFDLLNRSPNKTACIEYTEKNGQKPPGVELSFTRKATVRKPS
jgi:hypothetical protein